MILESSKSMYPREFAGTLRAEGSTITEVILLPGSLSGARHAIIGLHMRPLDMSIVGSVHSHPSSVIRPSEADLHMFSKYGRVHIITGQPYNENCWKAFDPAGNEVAVEVIQP